MSDTKRDIAIKEWARIGKSITELTKTNCKGINTEFLMFGANAVRKVLKDLKGEDGLHINDVAAHFGVTTVCIRNWLAKYELPKPSKDPDGNRAFIPLSTFEELIKHQNASA